MANDVRKTFARKPRNIVLLSDGTGQRGGLYFDEERSNVYKLYRATRIAPDSAIDPDRQLAFYDPGLGTLPPGGSTPQRIYRFIYNFISRATGLGITQNIIDCYAALIRLWCPGDRIFLFGFSRGAYTVRCLATLICLCGIPRHDQGGKPLKRDRASARKIATRAVKSVYQHVSSPRDRKYLAQRALLAKRFQARYSSSDPHGNADSSNAAPHFIGVFDTVAALSNTGSLIILFVAYSVLHITLALILSLVWERYSFWNWFGWVTVWSTCVLVVAYVYTHLKFAFRLPGYFFWDIIHLTTFRQKFYDQHLNLRVKYARHAISIDERRNDFRRVPWGARHASFEAGEHKIDPFEQFWFAGNHADVGGGYPENESRLSDIALEWMVEQATDPRLGEDALVVDRSVLHTTGRCDGMQHDETLSSVFRWAKKTLREPVHHAPLHASVLQRFELPEVQQYDVMAPYRPEALRDHERVAAYYANIPLPRSTCWQRVSARCQQASSVVNSRVTNFSVWLVSLAYRHNWAAEKAMNRQITLDSVISCLGLLSLLLAGGAVLWVVVLWQILPWLHLGIWNSYPLRWCFDVQTSWLGLQYILDWLLNLPVTLVMAALGILLFWFFGLLSAKTYQWGTRGTSETITPSQTRA
jgi:uncharacterized protein (DUF2235 family)